MMVLNLRRLRRRRMIGMVPVPLMISKPIENRVSKRRMPRILRLRNK
jgi:hypothetical protein